jgi:DNA helicase-2/ATP-dependent DNA helicase PcrA
MEENIFPSGGFMASESEIEEERRLFYVAMTRAKETLSVFTFQKAEEHSTFSKYLFPKEAPKSRPIRPQTRELSARRSVVPKALPPMEEFLPGRKVLHRHFGPGKIIDRKGDIITLSFENGAEKKLSLSTALRSDALKLS